MSKRAEMSRERRESVLAATASLLDEIGVGALTIRGVADRAGVAQGSVFMYARNKDDLVNQVYGRRIAEKWHDLLDGLAAVAPLDRVVEFYLGSVDIFYADLANVQALYAALGSHTVTPLETVEALRARVRAVLDEAATAGGLRRDVDLDVLDYSFQGLYFNVVRLAGDGVDHDRARRVVGESMRQLCDGVRG